FGEPAYRFSRRSLLAYLPQRAQVGTDMPVTVEELAAARRLASGRAPLEAAGRAGPPARRPIARAALAGRPCVRRRGDRARGAFRPRPAATLHALRRTAATRVHRQGPRRPRPARPPV